MVEGQGPRQERVDYAAKAPHIARECIGLLLEDLGSDVSQRTERILRRVVRPNDFSEAKVDDLRNGMLSSVSHHNVL